MAKNLYDLSIWIKAPQSVRAARYAKRDIISLEKAKKQLIEKESVERKNFKKIYGFDYFDQEKEADLVIDASNKSPEEIVSIIIERIRKKIVQ